MSAERETVSNSLIPIPNPPDPKKWICVQLMIPDSVDHRAAFEGAISNLATWRVWRRDLAHNAKVVRDLWQIARRSVKYGCKTEPDVAFVGMEDDMPFFREVCENGKCFLEFQCCPNEWVRLGNEDQISAGTQPGAGSSQPAPGGGTADYCASLQANNKLYIPTVLNTGDVVTLTASGAGNDPDHSSLNWYCPDGEQFFAGACVGFPVLVGTDPLPATAHMSLIINVNGTFHAFTSGSFTVPSGISNAPAYIQVNDSDLTNNAGSYQVCVTVRNNQSVAWCYKFDFKLTSGGFTPTDFGPGVPQANWVAGIGWVAGRGMESGHDRERLNINKSFTSTNIDTIKFRLSVIPSTPGTIFEDTFHLYSTGTPVFSATPDAAVITEQVFSPSVTANSLNFDISSQEQGTGEYTLEYMEFSSATGTNPFGASNC